jgi:hypothetical protein
VLAAFLVATIWGGYWQGINLQLSFLDNLPGGNYSRLGLLALLVLLFGYVHFSIRRLTADYVSRKLLADIKDPDLQANYTRAFKKNSRWYRSLYTNPSGNESDHPEPRPPAVEQTQAPAASSSSHEEPIETTAPKDATGP